MGLLDEVYSILANSKKGSEVPTATSVSGSDWILFWNTSTNQLEKILNSNYSASISVWAPITFGTVTSAGTTTTETEIANYINAVGFTVNDNEIPLLKLNVYINLQVQKRIYVLKSNAPGDYGTAAANEIAYTDIEIITESAFNTFSDTSETIDLGDIGSDTIEDHLNALVGTTHVLLDDKIYMFTCVKDSQAESYLYVGPLPNTLGDGGSTATASMFYLFVTPGWIWIADSWVQKGTGNNNTTILEADDIVFYKPVTYNANKLSLVGWKYVSGNTGLQSSYTKFLNIA